MRVKAQAARARMRCLVEYPFFVKRGGRIYEVGETFEGTASKVGWPVRHGLASRLDEKTVAAASLEAPDLGCLTVARLRVVCSERGINVPKRATKAQITALLGE